MTATLVALGLIGYAATAFGAYLNMALRRKRAQPGIVIESPDVALFTFLAVFWPVGWPAFLFMEPVGSGSTRTDAWATAELKKRAR